MQLPSENQLLCLNISDYNMRSSRALANPHKWKQLGRSDRAIWGSYNLGTAIDLQVSLSLNPFSLDCSCKSLTLPCQHSLGLFFFAQHYPELVPLSPEPSGFMPHKLPVAKFKPLSQSQVEVLWQAKDELYQKGLAELERWLADILRMGLARFKDKASAHMQQMSERLIDGHMAELARELKRSVSVLGGEGWLEPLLKRLSRLYLLTQAFKNRANLTFAAKADIYSALGETSHKYAGQLLEDSWQVMGRQLEANYQPKELRLWLRGECSGQTALLIKRFHQQELESHWLSGQALKASLVLYPSQFPLRAELVQFEGAVESAGLTEFQTIGQAHWGYRSSLAKVPWLRFYPMYLGSIAKPLSCINLGKTWQIYDEVSLKLGEKFKNPWHLRALSLENSLQLFGEYDGDYFYPLSTYVDGHVIDEKALRSLT